MALFSPPNLQNLSAFSAKPISPLKPQLLLLSKKPNFSLILPRATENGGGMVGSAAQEEKLDKKEEASPPDLGKKEEALGMNGTAAAAAAAATALKFQNPRWVGGTWDLKQFSKDGKTNWDAVIDAEARRRKWLEDNPESSSNEDPILFDTSIIPWWAWMKRFHLPEAELLNGRAAMIGFFTAYLVDSLTGVGLVDQMGNFFCKTLLFVAVVGVLLIRKNEDIDSLKKLFEETTLYDKQWQAAWKDESTSSLKKD